MDPQLYRSAAQLILAPSGAGKSWFAKHFPTSVVDGDNVVRAFNAWPRRFVPDFSGYKETSAYVDWARWQSDILSEYFAVTDLLCRMAVEANIQAIPSGRPPVMMMNPAMPLRLATLVSGMGFPVLIWMPSEDLHRQNLERRLAEGNTHQTTSWDAALQNREALMSLAATFAFPIIDDPGLEIESLSQRFTTAKEEEQEQQQLQNKA